MSCKLLMQMIPEIHVKECPCINVIVRDICNKILFLSMCFKYEWPLFSIVSMSNIVSVLYQKGKIFGYAGCYVADWDPWMVFETAITVIEDQG